MNKQEVLEQYNKNYTEEEYFKNNVAYAFSQLQLENAMKKLGAKDKTELWNPLDILCDTLFVGVKFYN